MNVEIYMKYKIKYKIIQLAAVWTLQHAHACFLLFVSLISTCRSEPKNFIEHIYKTQWCKNGIWENLNIPTLDKVRFKKCTHDGGGIWCIGLIVSSWPEKNSQSAVEISWKKVICYVDQITASHCVLWQSGQSEPACLWATHD